MRTVVNGRGARTTALLVGHGREVTGVDGACRCRTCPAGRAGVSPSRPSTASGSSSCTCRWSATSAPSHLSDILRDVPAVRTVVLGDLNEPPGGPTWTRLTACWSTSDPTGDPTFPAVEPRHRIDAILRTPDLAFAAPPASPSGPQVEAGERPPPARVDLHGLHAA